MRCFLIIMADETWKGFIDQIKRKQVTKRKVSCKVSPFGEVIIVRLSFAVSGRDQKYSLVGPREFVPFEYDELSIENIEAACQNQTSNVTEIDLECNVLVFYFLRVCN